jgi:parvulin-like peptidyl-prolyl isomerase
MKVPWIKNKAAVFICIGLLWHCSPDRAGNGSPALDPEGSQNNESLVLEIESAAYTLGDFSRYVGHTAGEEAKELDENTLSRLFDTFVDEKLLLAEARNRIGLEDQVPDEQLLTNSSMDPSLKNRRLIEWRTGELAAGVTVEPGEISAYYENNKRDFLRPARVKVSQILLDSEDKAVQALDNVKDGDESRFREVAQLMSVGVEANKGGAMGVFQMGELPSELETVIFSLQAGEISQVVESAYGYHLFRLDEKYGPELISEQDASPEIETKIRDRKFQDLLAAHIAELKQRLSCTKYIENLSFTYSRNGNKYE